jgi:hypothetical protein
MRAQNLFLLDQAGPIEQPQSLGPAGPGGSRLAAVQLPRSRWSAVRWRRRQETGAVTRAAAAATGRHALQTLPSLRPRSAVEWRQPLPSAAHIAFSVFSMLRARCHINCQGFASEHDHVQPFAAGLVDTCSCAQRSSSKEVSPARSLPPPRSCA